MPQPSLTPLGKAVVFLFILACLGGGVYMLMGDKNTAQTKQGGSYSSSADPSQPPVTIGIAYGTEKKRWLKWALEEFQKNPAHSHIKINLMGYGSIEGADAIIKGDKSINVWSPASAAYTDKFVQDWSIRYGNDPIASQHDLVLTPLVYVMWKSRYEAFKQAHGELSFRSIQEALAAENGWAGIPEHSAWGWFKFGHTNPKQSNSGLLAMILGAYDYHHKNKGLTPADIVDPGYQNYFRKLENGASTNVHSTGTLMREMVLKGPSVYDAIIVYENLAMSYFENAKGRSGEFIIVYPKNNIWNEHPYYVLNNEWTTPAQQQAAEAFCEFLRSEPIQKEAVRQGFRPSNVNVPINTPDSPFMRYASQGIQLEIPIVCEPPSAAVITNLFISWDRKHQP